MWEEYMEETKKNKKKRFIVIAVIFALFAFVGVGYAYLAQALNITGTANITSDFKVEFQEAKETTGADLGSVVLSSSGGERGIKDTVTITVTLAKPGDSYVATIPVKNTGKINAKYISLVPGGSNTQATGDVVLTFEEEDFEANEGLAVNDTHNFIFTFTWTNTGSEQQVPTTTTYTFTYTLNYQQA